MWRLVLSVFLCSSKIILFAQSDFEQRISIDFHGQTIVSAIAQLSDTTNIKFSYNPDIFDSSLVSMSFEQMPLTKIIGHLLGDKYQYKIRGSYVIVQKSRKAQKPEQINITGSIIDAKTGQQIEDVSVYDVNNLSATLSDKEGSYKIQTETKNDYVTLAISKEHYKDTIIFITNLSAVPIKLTPNKSHHLKNSLPTDSIKLSRRYLSFFKSKKIEKHNRNVSLEETRFIQASLFPVVGSNGLLSGKIRNNISLNIVAGYAHGIKGFEIGGVFNFERMDMIGFQAAGVSNIVGEKIRGVQIGGFSNSNFTDGQGVQVAGVLNTSGQFSGVQISGIVNIAQEIQGLQISGAVNIADRLKGVQLGVVNIAENTSGGVMIGFVNIARDGIKDFGIHHNDLTPFNLHFKSGNNMLFTTLEVGINPFEKSLWSYGFGIGAFKEIRNKYVFSMQATTHTIQPLTQYLDGLTIDNRLELSFGYRLGSDAKISLGPTLHYYLFDGQNIEERNFYEKVTNRTFDSNKNYRIWPGYHINMSF